ncbi:sugar phosphate isomerase/epimerase [Halalkalibacter sp. APA_J-10(15)]|uniref:sugar phosphate isomerase/epimerase family protein n=1 Tax=unclassified Halalkalibacter TaxID=2893063 RepID=UPI001FF1B887|nr:sugar phosphate isomerase/epimerase family protein [Halalkalibacter sp. APA_J-10(15)]MCK0471858.1 sugar phosphate isomerase/epimerase [Halalkalibacter sp. APA_J-10(15)]
MLKGVTNAGLGDVGTIEEFIINASKYGFESVDTSGNELVCWVEQIGLEEARAFLRKYNIQIGAIGLSVEWRREEEEFKTGLEPFIREAEVASALGCRSCVTYILPSTDYPPAAFMARAVRRFRTCAVILNEYDMKLGLEFVGPHHLRTAWKYPFIWTMSETIDLIEAIGKANVGLLIDAYHCYTTGIDFAELNQLDVEKIVHVHINDAKSIPVSEVLDNDRLYPGEGVINLVEFLKQLQSIGYQGSITQEVLTQIPEDQEPEQLWDKTSNAYDALFKQLER